ncbi:MAG: adenylate/guanylate cyclase domain-containing protein [Cyanobacteria bacterium P01_G01_bin.54]
MAPSFGQSDPSILGADILVVDDTPTNLRLISQILTNRGYRVRGVTSGSTALKAALVKPPDLILLDINMPEMDGYTVCSRLKAAQQTAKIPVVFLSALNDAADKVKAFEVGGVDYITKPFRFEEVLVRVENQLTLQYIQRQLAHQSRMLEEFSTQLKELHRLDTNEHATLADRFDDYLATGCRLLNLRSGSVSRTINAQYQVIAVHVELEGIAPQSDVPLAGTYSAQVVAHQQTRAYPDVSQVPELAQASVSQGLGAQCYIGAPLWVRGNIYGVLVFMDQTARSRPFSNREVELIELMAQSLSKVIATQQAEEQRLAAEQALRLEKQKSEKLLFDVLPQQIARRLTEANESIAEQFESTSILFADIVGFTQLSDQKMTPFALVQLLNEIFSQFDALAERLGLEKIKTIGDAYMVAGGLPSPKTDHLEAMAEMALAMQTAVDALSWAHFPEQDAQDPVLKIRIGIHAGPVVAGVIGTKRFTYDLWGDTVNVASRMESSGLPGKIQVTEAVYHTLQACYSFEERGTVEIKGKGTMCTYWLGDRLT